MLESTSRRLLAPGMAHADCPDKVRGCASMCSWTLAEAQMKMVTKGSHSQWLQDPAARLATIEAAGAAQIPFTTGILIGIGETREERLDALFAIRNLHAKHGHIQVGHALLMQSQIVWRRSRTIEGA